MKKIRAIESFDKLPVEICPCMLTVKTCQRDDNKHIFEIGITRQINGDQWFLHTKGDLFARKTCLVLMKEG